MLIAILVCLAIQRIANIGGWFQEKWFETYLKSIKQFLSRFNEWVMLALIIAPILLILALINLLCSHKAYGLYNLILSTIILLLCIDARDMKNKLSTYLISLESGDTQAAADSVSKLVEDVSSSTTPEINRSITKVILTHSFEHMFSGLFWFIMLGIYGLTGYFLISLIEKVAPTADHNYAHLSKLATRIRNILDWIPSRIVGISYSLAGNFSKGFSCFSKKLWSGLSEVKQFPAEVGLASLDIDTDPTKANYKENYTALDLINRSIIVWLIALFLINIGLIL